MPRRKEVAKREILPDPKYHSVLLAKFINRVMLNGKKSLAERIVYDSLDYALDHLKKNPNKKVADKDDEQGGEGGDDGGVATAKMNAVSVLQLALDNIRPTVEVRSRRVGGATYQVPVEVRENRRDTLAMRWLIECAKKRGEKGMVLRLAFEILDAIAGKGSAVKKREDMHKMAKANQAFAHFRWT